MGIFNQIASSSGDERTLPGMSHRNGPTGSAKPDGLEASTAQRSHTQMNRTITTALVVAAAAATGACFADDITLDTTPFTSTRSRAEVQAELSRGSIERALADYRLMAQRKSSYTRQQAIADYTAHRDEVAALNAQDSGSAYLAQMGNRPASAVMGGPSR
jgi:hypothetical protein